MSDILKNTTIHKALAQSDISFVDRYRKSIRQINGTRIEKGTEGVDFPLPECLNINGNGKRGREISII